MTNPFDIAASNSALARAASPVGTENRPDAATSGDQAPQGLFSAMLELLGGGNNSDPASGEAIALNPDQNWLNQTNGDPALSLTAQALQIAQGKNGLPDTLDAGQTSLDPALLGLVGQSAQAPTQTNTQQSAAGTETAPIPAPLLSARQSLLAGLGNATPDGEASIELAQQITTSAPKTSDAPGPSNGQPPQPGATGLEFVASRATRGNLPATPANPDPTALTLQNPPAADLAAALQRQFSPQTGRPHVGSELQKQNLGSDLASNIRVTGVVAAAALPAATADLAPLSLIESKLMGSTTDPLLAAQTLGQSTAPLGQSLFSASTPASFTNALQNVYQQAQVNIPNMAFEIARNFNAGNNRFQIRMDPPELGRIDVRLNIDDAGELRARLSVERPETLDLLQRDTRALERALQQAGFDNSNTKLEFTLQQNPFADSGQKDGQSPHSHPPRSDDTSLDGQHPELGAAVLQGTAVPGGLNVWA